MVMNIGYIVHNRMVKSYVAFFCIYVTSLVAT
jgi:hypothetical protein